MLNCKSVLCWFSPFNLVYVVKKCGVMGVLGSQPQEAMPRGGGADSERHTRHATVAWQVVAGHQAASI